MPGPGLSNAGFCFSICVRCLCSGAFFKHRRPVLHLTVSCGTGKGFTPSLGVQARECEAWMHSHTSRLFLPAGRGDISKLVHQGRKVQVSLRAALGVIEVTESGERVRPQAVHQPALALWAWSRVHPRSVCWPACSRILPLSFPS